MFESTFETKTSITSLKIRWFIYSAVTKDVFAKVKAGGKYIGEVARGVEGAKLSVLPTYKLHMRAHYLTELAKSRHLNETSAFEKIQSGFAVIDKTTEVDVVHLNALEMQWSLRRKLKN